MLTEHKLWKPFLYDQIKSKSKLDTKIVELLFHETNWRLMNYQLTLYWLLELIPNSPLKEAIEHDKTYNDKMYYDLLSKYYVYCDENVSQREVCGILEPLDIELTKFHIYSKKRLIEFLNHPLFNNHKINTPIAS